MLLKLFDLLKHYFDIMKPLRAIQQILVWLCVCPAKRISNKWKDSAMRMVHITFTCIAFLAVTLYLLANVFYLKSIAIDDMDAILYSAFQIIAYTDAAYTFIVTFLCKIDINNMLKQLSRIYVASMHHN